MAFKQTFLNNILEMWEGDGKLIKKIIQID